MKGAGPRPPGLAAGTRRTFRALAIPNYRLFFAGQLVSVTGTWMQRVAQDWLILELGGGPLELSIGVGLQSVPVLFLGIWGGLLVDRTRHVRLLFLATQVSMALLALGLGVLTISGHVTLWAIYLAALLVGLIGTMDSPARQSFVLEMVGPEDAANAVSLNSSINNSARLVGPAAAGAVIGLAGTGVAYVVNACTFGAIVVALLLMRPEQLTPRWPEAKRRGQILAGFAYAWRTHDIRNALVATLLVSALSQNFRVILPIMAAAEFHGGVDAYGWLMSALGLGALTGALVCAYIARPSLRMIGGQLVFFGAMTLAVSAAGTYWLALVLMVFVGAGNTSFNTTSNALVLISAEPRMRGRVLSIRALASNGTTPLGSLLAGWICSVAGARAGLAVGGLVALACSLVLLRRRASTAPAHVT
jgi:MFS family permease